MSANASQITGVTIVCPTVCSGTDQRKHQSSASLAFVRGIHRSPVDSPRKGPVTRKMFPFGDVIMTPGHSSSVLYSYFTIASQITSKSIVYSTASFLWELQGDSPHKGQVMPQCRDTITVIGGMLFFPERRLWGAESSFRLCQRTALGPTRNQTSGRILWGLLSFQSERHNNLCHLFSFIHSFIFVGWGRVKTSHFNGYGW